MRFRVNGTPVDLDKPATSVAAEPVPADSLPLKPSRRARQMSPETSQSPETSRSNTETAPIEPLALKLAPSQPASETEHNANTCERDSLDDVIDEAKAASHLVRNF